jgi:hypothetical protein
MDYGMIGKIEKARRYAREPHRVRLHTLAATFQGDNDRYLIHLTPEGWDCSCPGFRTYHICPHVMAMEKILKPYLDRSPLPYAPGQNVVSDIEKANRYTHETDRVQITAMEAEFQGDNGVHSVQLVDGLWHCTCDFFRSRGVCCHTMALERMFGKLLVVKPSMAAV